MSVLSASLHSKYMYFKVVQGQMLFVHHSEHSILSFLFLQVSERYSQGSQKGKLDHHSNILSIAVCPMLCSYTRCFAF